MAAPDAIDDSPVVIHKQETKESKDNEIDEPIIVQRYDSTETVTFTPKKPKTSMNGGHDDQPSMYTSLMSSSQSNKARGSFVRSKRGEILSTDLDNRLERLSRWIMAYFIFAISEMIYNSIAIESSQLPSTWTTTPYKIWLSSNVFLFLGCILGWFSLHHIHDIAHNAKEYYDEYLKYIAGGLFVLCGFLQWIAIIEQNHFNTCDSLAGIDSGINVSEYF